jgi:hypothetical protein
MFYHETPFYVISTWCRLRLIEAVAVGTYRYRKSQSDDDARAQMMQIANPSNLSPVCPFLATIPRPGGGTCRLFLLSFPPSSTSDRDDSL